MSGLVRRAVTRPVVINAVKVSLVVGSCLNLVNQGAAVWHGAPVQWGKFVLNYVVPYCVASYSAAKARQSMRDRR